MHVSTPILLLRRLLSWLGYLLFQLVLVVVYGLHLIRALRSPFRANELPRAPLQPYFWARPVIG
ncbi:hypothetical protein [Hymenobacter psychrophilus]|uniref:Uncharacterized protein n=1 Tax=Hymenobacter psychrophilus TaxID=651662 RepID=A0A1H3MWQ0_9BACT|nr:hypothetical protein [Hymenobacter psychrophilus]SDY80645.1 hypothetical protein SAMN04488069_11425 [Hymenobacter psychrophilus]